MSRIRFHAKLTAIGSQTILRLPKAVSSKLSSRGMNLVEGKFNGCAFQTALEPDGTGSHWFRVSDTVLKTARVAAGDSVSLVITPKAQWPEPTVPEDLARPSRRIRRRAAYGWTSRRSRAGIGSAGSARRETLIRERSGSKKRYPSSSLASAPRAASTAANAPIRRCHVMACCSNQPRANAPWSGRQYRKEDDAFDVYLSFASVSRHGRASYIIDGPCVA